MKKYRLFIAVLLLLAVNLRGDVVYYEGDQLPDQVGWERIATSEGTTWVSEGQFFQHVELGGWPGPYGQRDLYRKLLSDQLNETAWFVEWRMITDGNSEPVDNWAGSPVNFVLAGNTNVVYHFTIADDRVKFIRDTFAVVQFVDIAPGVPHTYRVELEGNTSYTWYIDGQVINSGVPGGTFPSHISHVITFGSSHWNYPCTTQWDYIRFGTLPIAGSGDFDSDGDIDEIDQHFFVDCLLSPGAAWQGCRWADLNADGIADGRDTSLFVSLMIGD